MTEMKLPFLGENITSAEVTRVLVKVGDRIEKDAPILEVETGKAALEVPATFSGVVKAILVKPGEKLQVGQPVLQMDADDGAAATPPPPAGPAPSPSPAPAPQPVAAPPPAAAPPPQPAAPPPPSAEMEHGREHVTAPSSSMYDASITRSPVSAPMVSTGKPALTSPAVRKLAREIGVDISQVPGTGPRGRISLEDVKRFSRDQHKARSTMPGPYAAMQLPDFAQWGTVERAAMTSVRKTTAQHLSAAWNSIPHVTQFDKADITDLEKLRKKFESKASGAGGKLTVTAILLKVATSALKVFPQFNASVDMAAGEIVFKKYYNIGIAVDTDRGLLVPVIREVDKKNILDISVELTKIAEKSRAKRLSLDDMQGGTFTISNLGGIGGTYFTPIINAPEVAILGVSRASVEPVYVENKFSPRLMLPLSLSYDHRLIDGADGARFLRWIVEALQQPFLLSLEG